MKEYEDGFASQTGHKLQCLGDRRRQNHKIDVMYMVDEQ